MSSSSAWLRLNNLSPGISLRTPSIIGPAVAAASVARPVFQNSN
jgi:hypothetical protein